MWCRTGSCETQVPAQVWKKSFLEGGMILDKVLCSGKAASPCCARGAGPRGQLQHPAEALRENSWPFWTLLHPSARCASREENLAAEPQWPLDVTAVDPFWLWSKSRRCSILTKAGTETLCSVLCRDLCHRGPLTAAPTSLCLETQIHGDLDVKNLLAREFNDSSAMEIILSVLICQGIPQFHTAIADNHCPFCPLPLIPCSLNFSWFKCCFNVPL